MSFIVYSLPRSRSFWLSRFLSYNGYETGHDEIIRFRSYDDIVSWFKLGMGSVETGASPFWRTAPTNIKTITIRRNPDDVIQSLLKCGTFDIPKMEKTIRYLDKKLDQIEARVPGVISYSYDDLKRESTCKAIFEHCLPFKHDHKRWQKLDRLNLQINLPHQMNYMMMYEPQLTKLAKQIKHKTIQNMQPDIEIDGITFVDEPDFDIALRDGHKLLEDHCVLIDQTPDDVDKKNVPLLKALFENGNLQILSARSNGRMFGYIMTIIGPTMESTTELRAEHTIFYADESFKGLGKQLQKEAVNLLKQKGISEIHARAGVRGDGPRLAAMYRRMGAESLGEMFKFRL